MVFCIGVYCFEKVYTLFWLRKTCLDINLNKLSFTFFNTLFILVFEFGNKIVLSIVLSLKVVLKGIVLSVLIVVIFFFMFFDM